LYICYIAVINSQCFITHMHCVMSQGSEASTYSNHSLYIDCLTYRTPMIIIHDLFLMYLLFIEKSRLCCNQPSDRGWLEEQKRTELFMRCIAKLSKTQFQ